jgi:hypothetical protein
MWKSRKTEANLLDQLFYLFGMKDLTQQLSIITTRAYSRLRLTALTDNSATLHFSRKTHAQARAAIQLGKDQF